MLPADPFADPGISREGHAREPCTSRTQKAPDLAREGTPVRTALAVESRDGHVCVFLPPLADGVDYAALVAAVEDAAAAMGQPIRLEGYPRRSTPASG